MLTLQQKMPTARPQHYPARPEAGAATPAAGSAGADDQVDITFTATTAQSGRLLVGSSREFSGWDTQVADCIGQGVGVAPASGWLLTRLQWLGHTG